MPESCSPLAPWGMSEVWFSIGPLPIRWYALAYIAGLVLGWRYALRLQANDALWAPRGAQNPQAPMKRDDVDELLFLATLGVILGGRIGYVLFYMSETNPGWWQDDPLRALRIWDGGMAFHGGLIGVAVAMGWLAWRRNLPLLRLADLAATATPIGLLLGRFANFINGELYGRIWDGSWAMRFPCDLAARRAGVEPYLRHPSQIYEALLEGLVLFIIIRIATHHFRSLARPGLTAGLFLIGYGLFRSFVENFRQPDAGLENLPFGVTMGMILSTPMWIAGVTLIVLALRRPTPTPA